MLSKLYVRQDDKDVCFPLKLIRSIKKKEFSTHSDLGYLQRDQRDYKLERLLSGLG